MPRGDRKSLHAIASLLSLFALVFGLTLVVGPEASANHTALGVCHRTEGVNAFVYIKPDDSSSHLDSEENPLQGHEGDRAATQAEFEAGQCFSQQPTEVVPTEIPTEVPTVVPTEIPTEVPTQVPTEIPTEVPTGVPTEVPTEVSTEVPTSVSTQGPAATTVAPAPTETVAVVTLPETGSGDSAGGLGAGSAWLALFIAAVVMTAGGTMLVRRSTRHRL